MIRNCRKLFLTASVLALCIPELYASFTINGATLTLNNSSAFNVNYSSIIINSGSIECSTASITLGGDWTNNGTFTPGFATVTFAGINGSTATITGDNTFYNLISTFTAKILKFKYGSTTTVLSSLILHDSQVRSTMDGQEWFLNYSTSTGQTSVDNMAVKDSNALLGGPVHTTNSTDLGNNKNWDFGPLSGSYDVAAPANNYQTLSEAVNAMEISGINGDVTFDVYDDLGGFDGILLDGSNIAGADSFTITFKAASGEEPFISTGNVNGQGVEIINTFKQLNFDNIDISSVPGNGYYFNYATLLAGATIQNCVISGYDNDNNTFDAAAYIIGADCDNIFISSNTIYTDDYYGIYVWSASGLSICDNSIYQGDNNDSKYAMRISQSSNTVISGNVIYDPDDQFTDSCIRIEQACPGMRIFNNILEGAGYCIDMGSGAGGGDADSEHIVIYNNLIKNAYYMGIRLDQATNTDVYFNTVYGDSSSMAGVNFACVYLNTSVSSTTVKNNILYNGATGSYGHCVWDNGNDSFSDNVVYDNNLYFSLSATNIFKYNTNEYTDLNSWRTGSGQGWDTNSIEMDPSFQENTYFRISSTSPAQELAAVISSPISITDDFEGDARDSTNPDAGYDENTTPKSGFATLTSVQDGDWDSKFTWDKAVVPSSFTVVQISHTITYNLNSSDVTCSSITVNDSGTLQFDTGSDLKLIVNGDINVLNNGAFLMPANTGYYSIVDIRSDSPGQHGITVQSGGRFIVSGSTRSYWRTGYDETSSGSTLRLTDAVNWRVGDVITVASTDTTRSHTQKATITAKGSSTDYTISPALDDAWHLQGDEVINLSRNCIFTGSTNTYLVSYTPNIEDFDVQWAEFEHFGFSDSSKYGVTLNSNAEGTISYSSVHDGYMGIYLKNSSTCTISDNVMYANDSDGLFLNTVYNNTEVKNNSSYYNGAHGFVVNGAGDLIFESNSSYANEGNGIYLMNTDRITVRDNLVYANSCLVGTQLGGIVVDSSTPQHHIIDGNTSFNNLGYGIHMRFGAYNTISNNTTFSNSSSHGIYINGDDQDAVFNNTSYDNGSAGIYLSNNSSSSNLIFNNVTYSNANNGIFSYSNSSPDDRVFLYNRSYGNDYGLVAWGSNINYLINNSFGSVSENTTADIGLVGGNVGKIVSKNSSFASSTQVDDASINLATSYIVSYLHNGAAGKTKVWGEYTVSTGTQKFNYADNTYSSYASTISYTMLSGAAPASFSIITDDSKTISEFWKLECTGTGPDIFSVKHGTGNVLSLGSPVSVQEGNSYTSSTRGVEFTIPLDTYEIGDTFYFITISTSNDANTQTVLEFSSCAVTTGLTLNSNASLEMIGTETYPTISTSSLAGNYYDFNVNGDFEASNYIFESLSSLGVQLNSMAQVIDLSSGTFDNIKAGGSSSYIRATSLTSAATFYNMAFDDTSGTASTNVYASGGNINWYFDNWSGAKGGPAYASANSGAQINWSDESPPGEIFNLTALAGVNYREVQLVWRAPGDDAYSGDLNSALFKIKYSSRGIITSANYDSPPAPYITHDINANVSANTNQSVTLTGLVADATYWFAIKTRDDEGFWSVWNSTADDLTKNTSAYFQVPLDITAPTIPVLLTPFDAYYTSSSTVNFSWSSSTDTESGLYDYKLEVTNYSDFNEEIYTVATSTSMYLIPEGEYWWKVTSRDKEGNYSLWIDTRSFIVDQTYPTVYISSPADNAELNSLPEIRGTAADEVALSTVPVYLKIYKDTDNYWTGGTFLSTPTWLPVSNMYVSSWTYTNIPAWASGSTYTVVALSLDKALNWSTQSAATFLYDTEDPESALTYPVNMGNYAYMDMVTGTAYDTYSGISQVSVRLQNTENSGYWDGDSWELSDAWLPASGTTNWSFDSSGVSWSTGTYRFNSRSFDEAGNQEAYDSTTTFYIIFSTPPAPTGFAGAATTPSYSVIWSWNSVIEADGYNILNAVTNSTVVYNVTFGSATYWMESSTAPNQPLTRYIESYNQSGSSVNITGQTVYTFANNHSGLSSSEVGSSSATLNWTANANPSYTRWGIIKSTDEFVTSTVTVKDFSDNYTTIGYTDTGLIPDTSYWYKVQAINEDGIGSSYNNTALVLTLADLTAPGQVTGFSAATGLQVTLNWTAPGNDDYSGDVTGGAWQINYSSTTSVGTVDGADSAEFSISISSSWTQGATAFTEIITGLAPRTTYWFWIKARDEYNHWSVWSDTVSAESGSYISEDLPFGITKLNSNARMAWADYDNDRDLDLAIVGDDGSNRRFLIYKNINGSLAGPWEPMGADQGLDTGSIDWGDYDNDGDLDLLVSGNDDSSNRRLIVYKRDADNFTAAEEPMGAGQGLNSGAAKWLDYDNDGDLDIVAVGHDGANRRFILFNNNKSSFTLHQEPMGSDAGVWHATLDIGDYDNDGDVDIALAGHDGGGRRFIIFENVSGVFSTANKQEPLGGSDGYEFGELAFGDYDNDGDLDLAAAGQVAGVSQYRFEIYENIQGNFSNANIQEPYGVNSGLLGASLAWGDYDNDGDLDIALSGSVSSINRKLRIYYNKDGSFSSNDKYDFLGPNTGVNYSDMAFGDYDNDGDLDFTAAGYNGTTGKFYIFRSLESDYGNTNNPPALPSSGFSTSYNASSGQLELRWNRTTDIETSDNRGLYYEVRIATDNVNNNVTDWVVSPSTGVGSPDFGKMRHSYAVWESTQPGFNLKGIKEGVTYYWQVRAIDGLNAKSNWSSEDFGFAAGIAPSTCSLFSPLAGYTTNQTLISFNWDKSYDAMSDINNYELQVSSYVNFQAYYSSAPEATSASLNVPENLYYWRVRSKDSTGLYSAWSDTSSFTVDTTGPYAPLLNSPSTSTWTNSLYNSFNWFESSDTFTSVVSYEFEIGESGSFGAPEYSTITVSSTTTVTLLNETTYFWRVRAEDSVGNTGDWSENWTIYIDTQAPVTVLTYPTAGYWNGLTQISGTAADTKSNIDRVNLLIQRESDGAYYAVPGSTWSASITYSTTNYSAGTWAVSPSINAFSDGVSYKFQSIAWDVAGSSEAFITDSSSITITWDISSATSAVTYPEQNQNYTSITNFQGTAFDAVSSVTDVRLGLRRIKDDYYWDGDSWENYLSSVAVTGLTSWTYTAPPLSTGTYNVYTLARDDAYPQENWETVVSSVTFNIIYSTPAAPVLSADPYSTDSINWKWNDVAQEDGYYLQASTGGLIQSLAADTTYWVEIGLTANTSYQRYIESYNLSGSSASDSLSIYTLAEAPSAISVVSVSSKTVSLLWTSGNPDLTRFGVASSIDNFATDISTVISSADNHSLTTATLSGLTSSTTYWFRVWAYNGDGLESGYLISSSTMTPAGAPDAPVTFSGTANTENQILWSWDDVNNEDGYRVRNSTLGVVYATVADDLSWLETGLTANTSYQRYIEAYNTSGSSVTVPAVRYTLAAVPPGLAVDAVYLSSITVSWTGNGTQYDAVVSDADDFSTNVTTKTLTATTTTFAGLQADTTYWFRVRALNGDDIETSFTSYESTKTLYTDVIAPAQITGFTAAAGLQIELSWTAPGNNGSSGDVIGGAWKINYSSTASVGETTGPDFAEYSIQLSSSWLQGTTTFARAITGLKPRTTYYFWISASDENNNWSVWSDTKQVVSNSFIHFKSLYGIQYGDVSLGDYDNDGYIDFGIMGSNGAPIKVGTYRNIGSTSTDIFNTSFSPIDDTFMVDHGSLDWGDYDNDGDLDILISGTSGSSVTGGVLRVYKNNGDATFNTSGIELDPSWGAQECLSAFGDYDNDGDLDIVVVGHSNFEVYKNKGDGTFDVNPVDPDSDWGGPSEGVSVEWGDYDNDGDLDILVTGQNCFKIYKNNGNGTFDSNEIEPEPGGLDLYYGEAKFADYDNDGDLDIAVLGNGYYRVYKNNGDGTYDQNEIKPSVSWGLYNSALDWGDYDNDGDLDIIIAGTLSSMATPLDFRLIIYENQGDGTFDANATQQPDPGWGVAAASVEYADVDNDGDLDILVSGKDTYNLPILRLYKSLEADFGNTNTAPSSPSAGLATTYNATDSQLELRWDKASDTEVSDNKGLYYDIRVATEPINDNLTKWIVSPSTGAGVPNFGYYSHSFSSATYQPGLNLQPSVNNATYYWQVRTIDTGLAKSAWSTEQSFYVSYDTVAPAAVADLSAQPGSSDGEIDISWSASGDDVSSGDITGGMFAIQYSTFGVTWSTSNAQISFSTDTVAGETQGYTLTSLAPGVTYYVIMWTADEAGNWSDDSNEVSTTSYISGSAPNAPFGLYGTAVSTYAVRWNWTDTASETGYKIYSSTAGLLDILSADTTSWFESGLSANTSSYIAVSAYNTFGSSYAIASAVYSMASQPGGFYLIANQTSVQVNWASDNPAGTRFGVSRSTDNYNLNVTTFVSITDNLQAYSTSATGLVSDTTYWFRVWAYNEDGYESGYSGTVSTRTLTVDTTLPTVAITDPADNSYYNSITQISGTALDNNAVQSVSILLKEGTNYWDGSTWVGAETWIPVTYSSPTWTYSASSVTFSNMGIYQLYAAASDYNNNITTSSRTDFYYDTDIPTSTVQYPSDGGSYTDLDTISGFQSDYASMNSDVLIYIQRTSDNQYWDGAAWQSSLVSTGAVIDSTYTWTMDSSAIVWSTGTYYIWAQAKDIASNYEQVLTTNTFDIVIGTPAAPSVSGTALTNASITWSWTDVTGEDGYKVYSSTGYLAATLSADTTTWLETGLSPNTSSFIVIEAYNSYGSGSSTSTVVYTHANVPDSLAITDVYYSSFTFSWSHNGNTSITEYIIDYDTQPFDSVFSTTAWITGTSYTLTGLENYTEYYVRIGARNKDGIGTALSTDVNTMTLWPNTAPSTCTLISPSSGTVTGNFRPTFDWTDASDSDPGDSITYQITFSTTYDFSTTDVFLSSAGLVQSQYTPATDLSNFTSYYWKVVVNDTNGASSGGGQEWILYISSGALSSPDAPSSLTATVSSTSYINWSWTDNSNDEDGFKIYSSTNGLLHDTLSANVTYWIETDLSPNTQYSRYIEAYNGAGTSLTSGSTAYTLAGVPGNPAILSVSYNTIDLQWDHNSVPANTQFFVEVATAAAGEYSTMNTLWSSADPVQTTISSLSDATPYYLRIFAKNGDGVSTNASPVVSTATIDAPPAAPSDVLASYSASTVTLSWTANVETDISYYKIYKSTGAGPFALFASTAHPNTSYEDTTVVKGSSYTYHLTAVDLSANESSASSDSTIYISDPTPPAAVTDLAAAIGSSNGTIGLTWTMTGDDNYNGDLTNAVVRIRYSQSSTSTYNSASGETNIAGDFTRGQSTSAIVSGLSPGVTYYLYIKVEDAAGNLSAVSNTASALSYIRPYFKITGIDDNVIAGEAISCTVEVITYMNTRDTVFAGTVTFTSDASGTTLPVDYKFTTADAGIHTFSDSIIFTDARDIYSAYIKVEDINDPTRYGTKTDITVSPSDFISGRVSQADGTPITGVVVDAVESGIQGFTDISGDYKISGLSVSTHTLRVSWEANDMISSVEKQTVNGTSNFDFTLSVSYELSEITGFIELASAGSNSGKASAMSMAVARNPYNSDIAYIELSRRQGVVARIPLQSSGEFSIPHLLPGTYRARAYNGRIWSDTISFKLKDGSSMALSFSFPIAVEGFYAYPNPVTTAHSEVTVRYFTSVAHTAKISIFNIAGELVMEMDGTSVNTSGVYRNSWNKKNKDGEEVASGIYIVMLELSNTTKSEKKIFTTKVAIIR